MTFLLFILEKIPPSPFITANFSLPVYYVQCRPPCLLILENFPPFLLLQPMLASPFINSWKNFHPPLLLEPPLVLSTLE